MAGLKLWPTQRWPIWAILAYAALFAAVLAIAYVGSRGGSVLGLAGNALYLLFLACLGLGALVAWLGARMGENAP